MTGPGLPRLIARVFLSARDREFIIGDLEELFAERVVREGRAAATRQYVRDVIVSVLSRAFSRSASPGRPPSTGGGKEGMMSGLALDVRSAVRSVLREPAFGALTIITIALGVGSTAAVFGMANQLLFRSLPGVVNGGGAAYLQFRSVSEPESVEGHGIPTLDFDELRRSATLFDGVASYGLSTLHVSVGDARPIEVMSNTVYGDFFEVLGVGSSAGRLLAAAETDLDADPLVAVISEKLHSTLFAQSGDAVGRTILVNGHAVTVLGVAGGGFAGPERGVDIDMWLPYSALVPLIGFTMERLRSRTSTMHDDIIVRLRDGVSMQAAEEQLASILTRLPGENAELREYYADLRPMLFAGLQVPPMWRAMTFNSLRILAGIVALVLLIACANVTNLLLVRNVKRRGAVATRRALGASSGRIARQSFVESLLLALLGTLAGLAVAAMIALPFRGERLVRMPAFESFSLDTHVLLFAVAVSILTAVLVGTVPATLAARFDLGAALREAGGRDTVRLGTIRSILSAGQIALSLALLVGGLLLMRTLRNLYAVDTGLDIRNVAALSIDRPRDLDGSELEGFYRRILATVREVPGVEAAALDIYGPHGSRMLGRVSLPGASRSEQSSASMVPVTPGWFELLGVEPVSGRTFQQPDWRTGSSDKVVLTASLARHIFGHEDVVGRRILAAFAEPKEREIVGVTEDIRTAYALDQPQDVFFVPFSDAPPLPFLTVLIRTSRFDAPLARQIRAAVERLLPDLPIPDPVPLSVRVDSIHSEKRLFSQLLALLSALALLLAAVGLYGVIAFTVAGRRREFGIRLALGAESGRIGTLVARHAAAIICAGTVLGLVGAFGLSRILRNRLFGLQPIDPVSYALAALLLGMVALAACWMPTRSAMRVDPVTTLKEHGQ